ncbi:putative hydrolase like protein [Verticillium longisporum]|uniref:Putative hydrolase like protein n=1 Tax=Verticillium longisporum TaxID=100787 RepID=A0A8I3AP75_VERLO|nr:putative hydrolase like protein [Verticillium longisporum]
MIICRQASLLYGELTTRQIHPSRKLEWHNCFDCAGQCEGRLDCAPLDVPMDWSNPSDNQRVVLAITRLPAVNKTDYRGPVIMNPGGAGGSGNYVLRLYGKYMQSVVGDNHDLVSFDPRGGKTVGASTPRYQCFDRPSDKAAWDAQDPGTIDADRFLSLAPLLYARAKAYSSLCERQVQKTGLAQNSGTAYIARDMLEIVNKGDPAFPDLKFWGFSYGTIIGGVFAAMFPDRVERILSDANASYLEWFRGRGTAVSRFGRGTIENRFHTLFETLKREPLVVKPNRCTGPAVPELITYAKLKMHLREALYQPYYGWPYFATILAALERGDGRPFYAFYHPTPPAPAESCEAPQQHVEEFVQVARDLMDWSPSVGAANLDNILRCVGRTAEPNYSYNGDFKAETKHPVLFINNVADPITPIVSAHTNAAGFPVSVVLQQNSYGVRPVRLRFASMNLLTGNDEAYFPRRPVYMHGKICF